MSVEGQAASLVLGQAANGLVAIRIPLALGINEVTKNVDSGALAAFSLGLLGLSMIGNTVYDALTLKEKNYSNNYTSTLFQTATGRPYVSALSAAAIHTAHGIVTDPVLWTAGGWGVINGDPNFYLASMFASTVTGTVWSLSTNALIKHNRVHNAVNWAVPKLNWMIDKKNAVRKLFHQEPIAPLAAYSDEIIPSDTQSTE
jgi:hypothetical protein